MTPDGSQIVVPISRCAEVVGSRITVAPADVLGGGRRLKGTYAAFVARTMLTGTPLVLFAQQCATCEAEAASAMFVTTIGTLVALPASIAPSAEL